jgi:hypothetical protein
VSPLPSLLTQNKVIVISKGNTVSPLHLLTQNKVIVISRGNTVSPSFTFSLKSIRKDHLQRDAKSYSSYIALACCHCHSHPIPLTDTVTEGGDNCPNATKHPASQITHWRIRNLSITIPYEVTNGLCHTLPATHTQVGRGTALLPSNANTGKVPHFRVMDNTQVNHTSGRFV